MYFRGDFRDNAAKGDSIATFVLTNTAKGVSNDNNFIN